MDENHQREELSRAYIHAVATVAGFATEHLRIDDDGIDVRIAASRRDGYVRSPRLEVQAKATGRDVLRPDGVHFPLRRKYYDDLAAERDTCALLVVLVMPKDPARWLRQTVNELALARCAYWVRLEGRPPLPVDQSGVTVTIPASQVFDVPTLVRIMRNLTRKVRP